MTNFKRFLTLFTILTTLSLNYMWGTDFTLTSASSVTQDGITVSFDKDAGSNAPAWYTAGLRLYAKNTVTISSSSNITSITFNWEKQGSKDFASVTASTGSYTHPSTTGAGTWTGSATSITFTLGASGQLQLNTLSASTGGASTVATPTFSPAEGTYSSTQSVTISCATTGATIYYTTDGSTPTTSSTEYSSAISVSTTTTIKAIATKSGMSNSAVASATYTISGGGGGGGGSCSVFGETWSGTSGTGGNDGSWSGTIAQGTIVADNSGWTYTKGNGADNCVKLGNSSNAGVATTPSISVSSGTVYSISFKAGAWSGDGTSLTLSASGATLAQTAFTMGNGTWASLNTTFTASSSSVQITFTGAKRFFLDDVCIDVSGTALTLSSAVSPSSSGTVTLGSSSVAEGGTTTATATPNSGYAFSSWAITSGDATLSSTTDNPTTVTMGSTDATITATFSTLSAYTVTFDPGSGSCGTTSLPETIGGAGVTLPTAAHACAGWEFAGWKETSAQTSTTTAPTLFAAGDTYHPTSNCTLYAVYQKAGTGGSTSTLTIYPSSYSLNNSYNSGAEKTGSAGTAPKTVSLGAHYSMNNAANTPSGASAGEYIQCQASNANIYNKSAMPGIITKVVVTQNASQALSLYCGTSQLMASDNTETGQTPSGVKQTDQTSATTMTWNVSAANNYTFFDLKKGNGTSYISSIEITYADITYTYNSNPTCTAPELSVSTIGIDFGTNNINTENEQSITILGVNLSEGATLTITGANADMFAVAPGSLPLTGSGVITGADNVTVTYNPTAEGTHTATLTVSSAGAADKTVLLSGTCQLVCTTPTISFENNTLYKHFGDADFTNPVTISGNALGAAVTYGTSDPSIATVDINTGVVHIVNACTSGTSVRITATIAAKSDGTSCQNTNSRYYTIDIKNRVTWFVNGEEYSNGTPTTEVYESGTIENLPETPDESSFCGGKTFMGWTTATGDWGSSAPTPLYKAASSIPAITDNADFHAVFATSSGSGDATMSIDFEDDISTYAAEWNISNYVAQQTHANVPSAHGGSYFGTTGGKSSGYAATKNFIAAPQSLSVWVSKTTDNTTTSSWWVTVSSDGSTWDEVDSYSATGMTKGTWQQFIVDLSSYSNVRVSLDYDGSTAVRCLDDLVLTYTDGSYDDYSSSCGTCLPAPTPTVVARSTTATITWDAIPDATDYSVICSGGTVSVSGTTANITGLSPNTNYTFTIKSVGTDPYTCFPKKNGAFTTTDCEDVPVLGTPIVTTVSATVSWTCNAATSTVRVYSDAACTSQVGTDHTSCTSPYEITALTSNTTYYYKVFAGGLCASAIGSFTTEEIKLDIAEWQTGAVVVSFNGDANLTLTTLTEETHGDPHANVAEDIFFSKYFEAAANVKLLAIFNGTLSSVDLSEYSLSIAQSSPIKEGKTTVGHAPGPFTSTKFKNIVKKDGNSLTADELVLKSNEELILISYKDDEATDQNIVSCAQEHEETSNFSSYIRIKTPNLEFNGDDAIALMNPDGDFIDLIGAGTKAGGSTFDGDSYFLNTTAIDVHGFIDRPGGWYNEKGYHVLEGNAEENNYALSATRCLLIRRNYVKSGHIAVELNSTDFVTLGDHEYMGNPREGEWKGVQIPGSTTQGTKPGLSNACDGFEAVGTYNYNDYYVDFEQAFTPATFEDFKSDPFDGTYVIPVTNLDDKACTMVRIELKDGSNNLVIRKDVKVPIMIEGDLNTTDEVFHSHYKDAEICRACDVVILDDASLTKVTDGTTGDINEVRDLKIYAGGTLIVPSETNYTVNSLAFRRQEDEVATANIQGGLTINESNSVFLDIRIDPSNWHYITLPYNCNISDITFSTGEPAILGKDYLLKWYNGEQRATTQAGGCWEMVGASSQLKKGIGYIVALPGDGIIKKELRFPMANAVINEEKSDKMANGVYGYGCDKDYNTVRANHRGWNLLGAPYFMPYTSDITDPLLVGKIVEDHSTEPWDGHYKFDEDPSTQLQYIVEPVNNGWSEYRQVAIADYEMKPFTCYFVQIGGSNPEAEQGVEFHVNKVNRSSIVRRAAAEYEEEEDTHPVWCAVDLTNSNNETDETTMLISNDFTDGYDIMNDLVKMRGDYYQYAQITKRPVLASRNSEGEMAFNALPDASAAAGIPLNYFAAYQGDYTISFNDKYGREEIQSVELFDATTQQYYDLLTEPYSFTTAKGNNNNRFTLYVSVERKKTPQIATDLDNVSDSEHPRKVLINGHVYILRGGAVYDLTGKQLLNR